MPVPNGFNGYLRVRSNGRYFTDNNGRAILLAGGHNWHEQQDDTGDPRGNPFDYNAWINTMVAHHWNFTRYWTGEHFQYGDSTTADVRVGPNPYVRSSTCCASDGGNKFDLSQFNQAYFDRMRSRVLQAKQNGIYVSVMLFDDWSIEKKGGFPGNAWPGHPMAAGNNINGLNPDINGNGEGEETHTLASAYSGAARTTIQAINNDQLAYIHKVIDTVGDLPNVLYEVSNEDNPSANDTAWQNWVVDQVHGYKSAKGYGGPAGITVQCCGGTPDNPYNSHADWVSPNIEAVAPTSKVTILDTDHTCGVCGNSNQYWRWFIEGNNLAYMDPYDGSENQGALAALGQVLGYAGKMDLLHMAPRGDLASTGYALVNPGAEYLVYQPNGGSFNVNLSGASGLFTVEWLNPSSGATTSAGMLTGGTVSISPPFSGAAVLYLRHA